MENPKQEAADMIPEAAGVSPTPESEVSLESTTEIPIEMYRIPGQDKDKQNFLSKYARDKKQNPLIEAGVKNSPSTVAREIMKATENKASLIMEALENPNIKIREVVAKIIRSVPEEERLALIKIGLKDKNAEVREYFTKAIKFILEENRAELIEIGLEDQDIKVQVEASNMIDLVPKDKQSLLKEKVLININVGIQDSNIETNRQAMGMIYNVPRREMERLKSLFESKIREWLNSQDVKIRKKAAEMIIFAPSDEKPSLIEQALKDPDYEIRETSLRWIELVPKNKRAHLINIGLEDSDIRVQRLAAKTIYHLEDEEQSHFQKKVSEIIRSQFFDRRDIISQKIAARMIPFSPREDRASLIKEGLERLSFEVKIVVAEEAYCLSGSEKVSIIENGINNANLEVQKAASIIIKYAPREDTARLFEIIMSRGCGDEIVKPRLYDRKEIDWNKFSRQKFTKTGSGTTLIYGDLKDRVIIRHIGPEEFLGWQSVYENHELWEKNGFDYIPIEPIYSYKFRKNKLLVDVYCGVLDLNLEEWIDITNRFKDGLEKQKNRIIEVLDSIKISHGHIHDKNFCLRFYRKVNGQIDFTRLPRLYLIDFDRTSSHHKDIP